MSSTTLCTLFVAAGFEHAAGVLVKYEIDEPAAGSRGARLIPLRDVGQQREQHRPLVVTERRPHTNSWVTVSQRVALGGQRYDLVAREDGSPAAELWSNRDRPTAHRR